MKATWKKYDLKFKFRAGTSRGVLTSKTSYFIIISDAEGKTGVGESSPVPGLSLDDRPDFGVRLKDICRAFNRERPADQRSLMHFMEEHLGKDWPALRMGLETAFLDYLGGGERHFYQSPFVEGRSIPINGLIWMGDREFMMEQLKRKLEEGFTCIKMKIGAIDFEKELDLLKYIRERFSSAEITIRVDANGAFTPGNVMKKLRQLEPLEIHSIEQPIKAGQWKEMKDLCRISPVPVGLDEELIGAFSDEEKNLLLDAIQPHYLILKPSLLGGFENTGKWIKLAEAAGTGWWITSALESNIGLNAICQFTYRYQLKMEQGLGTGQLFTNNIQSPLEVKNGFISYNPSGRWDLSALGIQRIE